LREMTEEWKGRVKEAIEKIGGAVEFCSWCQEYGLNISNPGYAWCYTTDQVMVPRDLSRFTKLMKACYLILERDVDEGSVNRDIDTYWHSTRRLKSARRELDKVILDKCERLVGEQFQKGSSMECQTITLDGESLWDIWSITEIGPEVVSVPYSRVEVPRKI